MSIDRIRAIIQYGDYYKESKANFISLLKQYQKQGKKVAVWGSGLKGNTFLQLTDKDARYIHCVIDMNTGLHGTNTKQGHRIVSPDYCMTDQIDVIIVMNEIFYVEIYLMLEKMGYTGVVLDADRIVKEKTDFSLIISGEDKQEEAENTIFGITMQDIQQKAYLILEEVDRICRKHKIPYFLEAGSALGVYRYAAFIPCDDDIDIAMLREDYERFLQIAPSEFRKNFLLQTMKAGSQYPYPYAQVVMDHTCFVRPQFKNLKMHHGIHIDVAPFDNVLPEVTARKKQIASVRHYTKLIRKKYVPELYTGRNWIKKFIVNYEYYLLKPVPILFLRRRLYKAMTCYNKIDTGMVGDLCTHYKRDISFEKQIVFPTVERTFVKGKFPTPRELEQYLEVIYDDYRQMSPRENGNTKYTLEEVSLEHNYREH